MRTLVDYFSQAESARRIYWGGVWQAHIYEKLAIAIHHGVLNLNSVVYIFTKIFLQSIKGVALSC